MQSPGHCILSNLSIEGFVTPISISSILPSCIVSTRSYCSILYSILRGVAPPYRAKTGGMTGEELRYGVGVIVCFPIYIFAFASVLHADGCIATATWTLHSFDAVSNFCLSFVQQFKHGLIYLSYSKRELYPVALYLNYLSTIAPHVSVSKIVTLDTLPS